jgi:hypothetical protein
MPRTRVLLALLLLLGIGTTTLILLPWQLRLARDQRTLPQPGSISRLRLSEDGHGTVVEVPRRERQTDRQTSGMSRNLGG